MIRIRQKIIFTISLFFFQIFFAQASIPDSGQIPGGEWSSGNGLIQASFDSAEGALSVTDVRTGTEWRFSAGKMFSVSAFQPAEHRLSFVLHDQETAQFFHVEIELEQKTAELVVRLKNDPAVPFDHLDFPVAFDCGKNGTSVVVPFNEGFLLPREVFKKDFGEVFQYSGGEWGMPFIGVLDGDQGWMEILETPNDLRLISEKNTALFVNRWLSQKKLWGYDRCIRFVFFAKGGYVAMAKRFRQYAAKKGLLVSLQQKDRLRRGNIARLIGAVNIWYWGADTLAFVRELTAQNFRKVLFSMVSDKKKIEFINQAGFLTSRYDIYQDVWSPECSLTDNNRGWPGDLMLDKNGLPLPGWVKKENGKECVGGIVCPIPGLALARKNISEDIKDKPYRARFLDTTTASPWRECYNPAHPATRAQDIQYRMKLLDFVSGDLGLVTGSEDGVDVAVPFVDYFEGMMSGKGRLPGAGYDVSSVTYMKPTEEFLKYQVGTDYRIPLWELVFHDCVVSSWYWGDATNRIPEVWWRRDLFNILYGNMPLWAIRNQDHWRELKARFVSSYGNTSPVFEKTGYEEMLTHRFLTTDHEVQETTFSGGTRVVVNFGETNYKDLHSMVKTHGFAVFEGDRLWKSGVCD